ncbi:MAG: NADPH-dependent oxidoreductase, partial [Prevotella sp.]|nr:NADPH-dependent oxidoreductase [Prevotella sp.]
MRNLINRRSIRKYSTKEVSKELLSNLLTDAERTP